MLQVGINTFTYVVYRENTTTYFFFGLRRRNKSLLALARHSYPLYPGGFVQCTWKPQGYVRKNSLDRYNKSHPRNQTLGALKKYSDA